MNKDFISRTVKIEKLLAAPIDLVWDAWTNPKHIIQWWNPKGSDTIVEKHVFVVGGEWKYTMMMPNGKPFIAEGTYKEIIHQERICSDANFRPMTEGVEIQAIFKAVGDKTEFTFNVIHPTISYKEQQERMGIQNGWGSVFNRLEQFLNTKIK